MCNLKFCGLKSLPHGGANDIFVSYIQISLVVMRNRARNCLKRIYHLWFRDPHFPPSLGFYTSCSATFCNFWPFEQLLSNLWFRAFFRQLMVFRAFFLQLFSIRENTSFLSDKNLFFMHFLSNKTNRYPC